MEAFNNRRDPRTKLQLNEMLVSFTGQLLQKPACEQHVLALESSELNTSRTLQKHGYLQQHIHIPNHNQAVCTALRTALPVADVRHLVSTDMIKQSTAQFDLVFLDYCCHASATVPAADMVAIFAPETPHLLADEVVMAHTFSRRGKLCMDATAAEQKFCIDMWQRAEAVGFCGRKIAHLVYHSMTFMAYILRRASVPYYLPSSVDVIQSNRVRKGSTVMVCYHMHDGAGKTWRQWFGGTVVNKRKDLYCVSFVDALGVEEQCNIALPAHKYSVSQTALVGSWFAYGLR